MTTATDVASSRPSGPRMCSACSVVHDEAVVGQDRLPGQGAHQEAGEERRDHQHQHEVLPPAGLERDGVGQRVGEQQREHGRQRRRTAATAGTAPGTSASASPVVRERPGHRVAGLERAVGVVERRGDQLDGRHHEEDDQPEHARQQQQVARLGPPRRRRRRPARDRGCPPATAPACATLTRPLPRSSSGVGLVAGVRVLVGVEQEGVLGGSSAGRPASPRRKLSRAPLFCSNTVSSWPQGIRTRYCVLTPMKLTSLTVPPREQVAAVAALAAGRARNTFSGRTPDPHRARRYDGRATPARRACCRGRRRRRRRRRDPTTSALHEVGLAEEVGDERGRRRSRRARRAHPSAR